MKQIKNDQKTFSSNINEVVRSVLNFLFIFFFNDKISQVQKKHKTLLKQLSFLTGPTKVCLVRM